MTNLSERLSRLSPEKRALLEQRLGQAGGGGERNRAPIVRLEDGRPSLPSPGQERLWFIEQIEGGTPVYNIPIALRLLGTLNESALSAALNELAARHETLRTRFVGEDGRLRLEIADRPTIQLPVIDCTEESLLEGRQREAKRVFQLHGELPFRATLFRIGNLDHELLLNLHHIIADRWSINILLQELGRLYNAGAAGQSPVLCELPVRYSDYARWQRETLVGPELEQLTTYWTNHLSGSSFALQIRTDRPRPVLQTFNGSRQEFSIPTEQLLPLKAFCRRENVTPFMVLLATLYAVLYRYSGETDIVVGTPVAARTRVELEGLIGFFTNTLALRGDLTGNPSFRNLVRQVRETALGAFAHQEMPFEKLVEALHPERDLSRSLLFQVMFVLHNNPSQTPQMEGLQTSLSEISTGTAKFDLTLHMREDESGWTSWLVYNTDIFDAPFVTRLWNHFCRLLLSGLANPEQPVQALPMLTDDEQRRLLLEWNDTHVDYPLDQCLHEFIEAQVARTPDAPALRFKGSAISFTELNHKANQLGHYLRNHCQVGPDVVVGVFAERSLELVVALVGILKAGGAYLPLDPECPTNRLATMLEDAQARVVLTQHRFKAHLPQTNARVLALDSDCDVVQMESAENPPVLGNPSNLAYLIYTSGSSGAPKGVAYAHQGVVNRLLWMQDEYKLSESDRVLQKTPYTFDVSVWEFFWPLITGACLVIAEPGGHRDSEYLVKIIRHEVITTLHFVPSMLQLFLEAPGVSKCSSIQRVMVSGEALSAPLRDRFFQVLPAQLHNQYGPTEAGEVTSWACAKGENLSSVPLGRPIANTQIYILDSQMSLVPPLVAGELYIGGVAVARGYLNKPSLTDEKFVCNPFSKEPNARIYKTGDLARYCSNGTIEYLGRMDSQVKLRGFRIELGEIEAVLQQQSGVKHAAVIVREDTPGDQRLAAYFVVSGKTVPDIGELRTILKSILPDYMVPSDYVALDAIPLTPNGKLDRKALPRPVRIASERELQKASVLPRNPKERKLVDIFQQVLGVDHVGIDDDFFDIGGHSFLAAQAISRINAEFGTKVPLVTLFQHPTITRLAPLIGSGDAVSSTVGVVTVQAGSGLRPFFCVNASRFMRTLAGHLGRERPFLGLYLSERKEDVVTVEEAAAKIIEALQTVQPEGPYYLGGWCVSGVLAYEVAQQLRSRGSEVALLAMFDSHNPGIRRPLQILRNRVRYHWAKLWEQNLRAGMRYFRDRLYGALLWSWFAVWKSSHKVLRVPEPMGQMLSPEMEWVLAVQTYKPKPYDGRVALFLCTDSPRKFGFVPAAGWAGVAEKLEVLEVPGDHRDMFNEPNIEVLAEKLRERLDSAEDSGRTVTPNAR